MLRPQTILVTGGARRLGAAIVRTLAARGHAVIIHHHDSDADAGALAVEIQRAGGLAAIVRADLARVGDGTALIAQARAAINAPVDGLVNNASLFAFDTPAQIDATLLDTHYRINLAAPVLLASALAAQEDVRHGAVVNILDQKIANPNPDYFSYSCAKWALDGATTMLAQALGPRIRVNAVAPGLTLPSGGQSDASFAAVARANLLCRPVGADQVADAVTFLIGARGIVGQTIFVDCGQRFVARDSDVMFEAEARPHG